MIDGIGQIRAFDLDAVVLHPVSCRHLTEGFFVRAEAENVGMQKLRVFRQFFRRVPLRVDTDEQTVQAG